MAWYAWFEHVIFALVVASFVRIWMTGGGKELARAVVLALKHVPGVERLIKIVLHSEASKFIQQTTPAEEKPTGRKKRVTLPKTGIPASELRERMKEMRKVETDHLKGHLFAYTYTLDNEQYDIQKEIWNMWEEKVGASAEHNVIANEFRDAFLHENALNPMIYPSLRRMETEIVSMAASMLNGDEKVVGFLTSGGTESILMAVKTYRDRARKLFPQIKKPNMIAPESIHPCMEKACHYFGLEIFHAPLDADYRVDVKAMEKLINPNTILLAASAPQFAHGLVDPIEQVSDLAVRKGLPLHIDSCFGGFMLPWVEKLGYPVPKFDFRNPGVTSISADAHKWGFCVKGSSVILYRNDEYRRYQIFSYSSWCGGLYGSPSMAGTRPAGNIASTWATMNYLGEEGYLKMARQLMDTTTKMIKAINETPGIKVVGQPHMNCFAITSRDPEVSVMAMADCMEKKGFKMERQQNPDCVHLSILPHHIETCDYVIKSFQESAAEVKANKALAKEGTAALYGMMAIVPDKAIISDFVVEFFSEIYK